MRSGSVVLQVAKDKAWKLGGGGQLYHFMRLVQLLNTESVQGTNILRSSDSPVECSPARELEVAAMV